MFDDLSARITKAPEFPSGFDWINSSPLSLEGLKGHIVVLDFWTYCCINCMHTLPVLAELEKKYEGKPVVFIGVHSAKFPNEQEMRNIEHAVSRYEISHPVLVDKNMTTWSRYMVAGWPTIVIIDPKGVVVYKQSGEGQKEMIEDTIDVLLEKGSRTGAIAKEPLRTSHRRPIDRSILSYPGKIAISSDMIAISDSNHNRILVTDMSGKIMYEIGSGRRGFSDGSLGDASFFRPQGIVWDDRSMIVADTENHAVRRIDLDSKRVTTIAGTGRQGPWMSLGGSGRETQLSSPWDVAIKNDIVFIAMAGTHQIWTLEKNTGLVLPYAGSGHENIIDGSLKAAQLAQPSGLSIFGEILYFADSETSSIREIDLKSGSVKTITGRGLFEFGHRDGPVGSALFQHPLGLCATAKRIFVADTYNSALRTIDLESNEVSTIIGGHEMSGICRLENPKCDSLGLYEPSDVKVYQDMIYISDTNNHMIRIYDQKANVLKTLTIGVV